MRDFISLPIKWLDHAKGLAVPEHATAASAGLDLCAAIAREISLGPGERQLIPCGFSMALPHGFEAQIRPRSGLAHKHGITVLNSPGTIDADYRGEVHVLLINLGIASFEITRGMRIAQMVIACYQPVICEVQTALDFTQRGSDGFG
ncbi:MAG: dUTP diphosphatase, partial [Pseudomonadota bacterium]